MNRLCAAILALAIPPVAFGSAVPKQKPKKDTAPKAPRVVHFDTSDGVRIVADYYPPSVAKDEKAPVAILIHMYPADRTSWKPLAPRLTAAGFAVLAYDIRGHGDSVKPASMQLRKKYDGPDSEHFNNAWRDAEAARKWLSSQPNCDTNRIALIGASIGCSISLHYGSKDKQVRAIVCLSPGTNYMGVDSIRHIRACGQRAILLLSPEGEYEAVKRLVKASGGVAQGDPYPGSHERHGTRMFAAPYGEKVMKRIVRFVQAVAEKSKSAAG
ncbi:MAG: alpha/beta hydrolase [Phycisphaerae bacterium]